MTPADLVATDLTSIGPPPTAEQFVAAVRAEMARQSRLADRPLVLRLSDGRWRLEWER